MAEIVAGEVLLLLLLLLLLLGEVATASEIVAITIS